MRVDQRDDHEERLLLGGDRAEVLEDALVARLGRALGVHEAAVVVGDPSPLLGDVLVGARVLGIPAGEAVLVDVLGDVGRAVGRLDAVELALVDGRVAGGGDHGRRVLEAGRELDLIGYCGAGHVGLERVLDAVLGGEVAGHQRRASRRAHAGVRERVLEGRCRASAAGQAGHVALRPTGREVLDRALLVGHEDEHVHARRPRGRATARPRRVPARPRAARRRAGARARRRRRVFSSSPRVIPSCSSSPSALHPASVHLTRLKTATALLPNAAA